MSTPAPSTSAPSARRDKSVAARPLFDPSIVKRAIRDAFGKLDPRRMIKNPVMFVVEIGSVFTTILFFHALVTGNGDAGAGFIAAISLWLWFTVLFANFAEAMAEGRGKAQADSLRKARRDVQATVLAEPRRDAARSTRPSSQLRPGDLVWVEAGQVIPGDGEIIEGVASVNESAITGESAPVIRESGGDRSAVTGGTTVLSDWLIIRVSTAPGESFLDRMIAMVEGAKRKKTPNEIALDILLAGLTIIFLLVTVTLLPFSHFAVHEAKAAGGGAHTVTLTVLVALLVCLIPTTIGGLLSAIGIAGMDRMIQANVLATSGRAVEAAGDVDILLLDKTGTITHGNRQATAFLPARGVTEAQLAEAAVLSSLSDDTPEGKSIVALGVGKLGRTVSAPPGATSVAFTAQTRMSGIDFDGRTIRKGAGDAIARHVSTLGAPYRAADGIPADVRATVDGVAKKGATPLVVCDGATVLGVVQLADVVKDGIKDRFGEMRRMGIKTVMITGDNPLTAAAIAAEAGVDDFLAEATPENKLAMIRDYQAKGHLVAMTGDGTNDAPALAQADVAVAMNSGTQAAKEAGNMVDLDSNPTKLLEVVTVGKQMLMTRGALTTFSIANDVSKYFAIIPAAFVATYPQLAALNVMKLHSPASAVLSAVIFNALIIIALIPIALRGLKIRPAPAAVTLRRNILVFGVGGLLLPFPFIKLIDVIISGLGLVS
ncbi:MAG TPA: potassium-transporting ATPase subunit KdpB [Kofleriaceae bacterium]|nr:potassium-transporting ATPase subunit KdpB [Kofleriaceae bacterium]